MWEDFYGRPAIGDPVFESQPTTVWLEHMAAKWMWQGHGVELVDGALKFVVQPTTRSAKTNGLTGDSQWDDGVRRQALGAPDLDDEDDEG